MKLVIFDSNNSTTASPIATTATTISDAPTVSPIGMDGASDGWLKAFALCSVVSACLSIVGSSLILRRIYLQRRATNTTSSSSSSKCRWFQSLFLTCAPYTHLMLGLSLSDIFASLVYTFFNFLDPQESSSFSWAIGNQTTCDVVGFLSQLSLTSLFYNAMLSFYYMLTIRFAVTEQSFATYWEPWLHLIVLGYPVSTGLYLLVKGHFDDVDNALSCWVTNGDLAWIVVGVPVCLIFVIIVLDNLVIYCFVRRTIRQSARYHTSSQTNSDRDIQSVATMAFLYVGTFLISYIWAYATSIVEFYTDLDGSEPIRIAFRLLYHIFHPLQGFWMMLVFCRPRYLKYQKRMQQLVQRQEQRQNQRSLHKSSQNNSSDDMMTTTNPSSDFGFQDETPSGEEEVYDTSVMAALLWAIVGPEELPYSGRRGLPAHRPSPNSTASGQPSFFGGGRRILLFGGQSFQFWGGRSRSSLEFWKGRSSLLSSTKDEETPEDDNGVVELKMIPLDIPDIDDEDPIRKTVDVEISGTNNEGRQRGTIRDNNASAMEAGAHEKEELPRS